MNKKSGETGFDSGKTALSATDSVSERFQLKRGISPSQARFLLSNFCLDVLGATGQELATVVELCNDVGTLQLALDNIRNEMSRRHPDKRAALVAVVREINETDF